MPKLLLIVLEVSDAESAASFAQSLGLPFDILSLTGPVGGDLGAETLFSANFESLPPSDGISQSIASLASPYSHIAAMSSMGSKDLLARVAGHLDAAMVTDVIQVESPSKFLKPMLAGTIIATVEVLANPVVLTVRPSGSPPAKLGGNSSSQPIALEVQPKSRRLSSSTGGGNRPDLGQAKVVVSGGRPLKDAETFERLLGGLADKLGGAVGATRAAVDSGIAPNELQVGQTGKIVSPNLYIAAGISGSTQHIAGMKESKLIVAINKDADAPIFDIADLGIVADLFDVIPQLIEKL